MPTPALAVKFKLIVVNFHHTVNLYRRFLQLTPAQLKAAMTRHKRRLCYDVLGPSGTPLLLKRAKKASASSL